MCVFVFVMPYILIYKETLKRMEGRPHLFENIYAHMHTNTHTHTHTHRHTHTHTHTTHTPRPHINTAAGTPLPTAHHTNEEASKVSLESILIVVLSSFKVYRGLYGVCSMRMTSFLFVFIQLFFLPA